MPEGAIARSGRSRPATWAAACLVALALALRFGVLAGSAYSPTLDSADYDRHAVSLAGGHGYPPSGLVPGGGPSAFRPPLYPLALAAVYAVSGTGPDRIDAARAAQAVAGVALVGMIGLLAFRLWGDRRIALLALGVAAVYPPLVLWGMPLVSEPMFLALEVGAVLLALRARRSLHPLPWVVLCGMAIGLATLTRPPGAILLIPLGLAVATRRRAPSGRGRALAAPLALLVAAGLTVLPWTIRNAVVLHRFVPISTQGGFGLAGEYNDGARTDPSCRACWRPDVREYRSILLDPSISEADAETRLRSAVLRFILRHPAYPLEAGYWNTVRMFELGSPGFARRSLSFYGFGPLAAASFSGGYYVAAGLALAGALSARVRRGPRFVWLSIPLFVASSVFGASDVRFRAPLEPFVVILAAAGAIAIADRVRRRRVVTG